MASQANTSTRVKKKNKKKNKKRVTFEDEWMMLTQRYIEDDEKTKNLKGKDEDFPCDEDFLPETAEEAAERIKAEETINLIETIRLRGEPELLLDPSDSHLQV